MATRPTKRVQPKGLMHARRSTVYLLLGLVATFIPLPWTAIALVPLMLAAWESIRSIRALSAENAPARSMVWTVMGLVLIGVLAAGVALPYVFYSSSKDYRDCMVGANTAAAQAECKARFYGDLGQFARLGP